VINIAGISETFFTVFRTPGEESERNAVLTRSCAIALMAPPSLQSALSGCKARFRKACAEIPVYVAPAFAAAHRHAPLSEAEHIP
jgi:hypothetical protein